MTRSLVALLALGAALSQAAPAAAEDTVTKVPVSYADLNLAAPEGRLRLAQRIDAAVREACGGAPANDLIALHLQRECQQRAYKEARPRMETVIAEASRPTQLALR